jgi:hypothetical protein
MIYVLKKNFDALSNNADAKKQFYGGGYS